MIWEGRKLTISALEAGADWSAVTNVAGVAGLFVAKLHKLHDRIASGAEHRRDDKDVRDVIRLMQATLADEVGSTPAGLWTREIAGPVSRSALGRIEEFFGRRGRIEIQMAASALRVGLPQDRVEVLSVAYTAALLASASKGSPDVSSQ